MRDLVDWVERSATQHCDSARKRWIAASGLDPAYEARAENIRHANSGTDPRVSGGRLHRRATLKSDAFPEAEPREAIRDLHTSPSGRCDLSPPRSTGSRPYEPRSALPLLTHSVIPAKAGTHVTPKPTQWP